jgi:hypothetical protein
VKNKHAILLAAGFCLWSATPLLQMANAKSTDLPSLWERYYKLHDRQDAKNPPESFSLGSRCLPEHHPEGNVQWGGPGKCVGEDAALAAFMRESSWKYRAATYELYFASSTVLARSVYGLAVQSGDVDRGMPLKRFERGVRGFHYSVAQVCAWFDAAFADDSLAQTDEERRLMRWLLDDRVVKIVDGRAVPGGVVKHILGAAPGKKRGFKTTLRHERLHILWDEDEAFSGEYRQKWDAMSDGEKQTIRKNLSAYSQSNEAQLMEEWAIYQAENLPEERVKKLVGL